MIAVALGMDPLSPVLEEFLPDPSERTSKHFIGSFILRLVLSVLCSVEFVRWYSFAITVLMVTAYVARSVNKQLNCVCFNQSMVTFLKFRVLYVSSCAYLSWLACRVISMGHMVTVMLFWILISLWRIVPAVISVLSGICGIFMVAYSLVGFAIIDKVETESRTLIQSKVNRLGCMSYERNNNLYKYKWWIAQRPVQIRCGPFFLVNRATSRYYVGQVIDKLASAVLLINPKSF